jgi:hypothetical protein
MVPVPSYGGIVLGHGHRFLLNFKPVPATDADGSCWSSQSEPVSRPALTHVSVDFARASVDTRMSVNDGESDMAVSGHKRLMDESEMDDAEMVYLNKPTTCTRSRTLAGMVLIVAIVGLIVLFESGVLNQFLGGGAANTSAPGSPGAPVDCVVSPWVDSVEGCTQKCGGSKTQTRTVVTQDANGGKQCPILWRTVSCDNSGCPVDCVVGPWSPWSGCSAPCGAGTQSRLRDVTTPPKNGGVVCPALSESQSCAGPTCPPKECPCQGMDSCNNDCHNARNSCDNTPLCKINVPLFRVPCLAKCQQEFELCQGKMVPC